MPHLITQNINISKSTIGYKEVEKYIKQRAPQEKILKLAPNYLIYSPNGRSSTQHLRPMKLLGI